MIHKKTIATFYTTPASLLPPKINSGNQRPFNGTLTAPPKLSSTVTKTTQKLLPPALLSFVNAKDLLLETTAGNATGKIMPNSDLGILATAHAPYLVDVFNVVKQKKLAMAMAKTSRTPAGTEAAKDQLLPANITKMRVALFSAQSDARQMSPVKWIALLKSTFVEMLVRDRHDQIVLCCSGHWTRLDNLEGDHAYPASHIEARFFYLFGATYDQVAHGNPVASLHEALKANIAGREAPNKPLLMMHFLDAHNLMPLCSDCNGNKNANYLSWFINHPKYGVDFITAHFPLDYSRIVPRTKDGQGLGDAAMSFLFSQHAIYVALNPPQIKIEVSAKVDPIVAAKELLLAKAPDSLSPKELAIFRALLLKIS